MKRQTILGTLAALAFAMVTFAFATPASAIVTCSNVGASSTWPNGPYTQKCGSIGDGQVLVTALIGEGAANPAQVLQTKMTTLHTANPLHGVFYLFHDATDFMAWATVKLQPNERPASVSDLNGDLAFTQFSTTLDPLYTVVFEHVTPWTGTNGEITTVTQISSTGHEAGHWLDRLWSHLLTPIAGQPALLSNTNWFNLLVQYDYAQMDKTTIITKKCLDVSPHGFFNVFQYRHPTTGAKIYYCNQAGNGPNMLAPLDGAILKISDILSFTWSGLFNNSIVNKDQKEIFAQAFTIGVLRYADNQLPDYPASTYVYFGTNNPAYSGVNLFACTIKFIDYVYRNNALPPAGTLPSGCPAKPAS